MKQQRPYPRVIVSKKSSRALAGGHPWVFAEQVIRTEPSDTGEQIKNGCVVDVFDESGTWRGAGLISEKSSILVRLVTTNANDRINAEFWRRKIRWALDYRTAVMGNRALHGCEPDTNCCRLIFSEADGFPGLIVDRYEDLLVAQVGTVGMQHLRTTIYPLLVHELFADGQKIRGLYERNDTPSRRKEGLPLTKGWFDFKQCATQNHSLALRGVVANGVAANSIVASGTIANGIPLSEPTSSNIVVHENGIAYNLDLKNSQKTGFFLDQKYNRRAVRFMAKGKRVLDCFCHVGPFGLNAAAGQASFVREVDISETAIELARANAKLNGFAVENAGSAANPGSSSGAPRDTQIAFTCANVLEYLPHLRKDKQFLREEGGPFDFIILDPPAFTKSRSTIKQATRGYKEINREAMRLLPRGGYLATCSCSHFMTRNMFVHMIQDAARESGVRIRQIEERQQAPDHPIVWGIPETHYLDFFIFQVV